MHTPDGRRPCRVSPLPPGADAAAPPVRDGIYCGRAVFAEPGRVTEHFDISVVVLGDRVLGGFEVGRVYGDGRIEFSLGGDTDRFRFRGRFDGDLMRGHIDTEQAPACRGRFELQRM